MSTIADDLVAQFILRDFRGDVGTSSRFDEQHLAECAEATATHLDGEDGTYGCDTGCPYATLTARITCPHGHQVEHEYGDFGEIADIIDEIRSDEEQRS